MIKLSIIITTFNGEKILRRCLWSIKSNLDNYPHEVIIVDNASTDNTEQMVKSEFPEIIYIKNQENYFFAKANNQGLKYAKGKYILLVNNDVELIDSSVKQMVDFLEDCVEYAGACGRLLNYDGTQQIGFNFRTLPTFWTIVGELFLLYRLPILKKLFDNHYCINVDYNKVQTVEQPAASFFMIRKSVIDKIGLFNENLYYYYNDVDFCNRLKKNNYKIIYLPQVQVYHVRNASQKFIPSKNWVKHYYSNLLSYSSIYFSTIEFSVIKITIILSVIIKLVVVFYLKIFFPKSIARIYSLGAYESIGDLLISCQKAIETAISFKYSQKCSRNFIEDQTNK